MPVVREIFWICVEFNITVSSVFLSGKMNVLVDRLSRLHSYTEAMDARLLLANFSLSLVQCAGHMEYSSFLFLQRAWIQTSYCCVLRPRHINKLR